MRSIFIILFLLLPNLAQARDQIRIVGSSTVFPFVSAAAEQFGREGDNRTPIVESTGTGGGIKMFCDGVGENYPDMANASRAIKSSEVEQCNKSGVSKIIEIPLGYDGIVVASSQQGPRYVFTKQQLFLAMAREVPKDGKLIANPYTRWKQIDASLPDTNIEIYGPPPVEGTRDALVELLMHKGCEAFPEYKARYTDSDEFKQACGAMREDGHFIEVLGGNVMVQKLVNNSSALAIFGYNYLQQNNARVKASPIDGVSPAPKTISDSSYGLARMLYVYVKGEHLEKVPGLAKFTQSLTTDAATGPDGYLVMRGLLALPKDQHEAVQAKAHKL